MKYKTAIPFVILILLTAAVIFIPRAVSDSILLATKNTYREYSRGPDTALTDDRFAEIYVNGGFGEDNIGYPSKKLNENEVKQGLKKLFEKLFCDNAELLSLMTDAELLSFDGRSFLTDSDDRTIVVRFSSAELSFDNAHVTIVYEEKTSTLISLSYFATFKDDFDTKKETMRASEIMACAEKHFKEHLHLNSDGKYSDLFMEQVKENGIWYCAAEIGLKVVPRYEGEIREEKIYNSDT